MFKSIRQSFGIVGKNLILAQPFILFLLVISLLGGGLYGVQGNPIAFIVFALSLIMLSVAFMAGWFYMTKKTIEFEEDKSMPDEEKAVKSFGLIKHFFPGVGEYFINMIGLSILYLILTALISFAAFKFGMHMFGNPNVDIMKLNSMHGSYPELNSYFASLPERQLYSLTSWFAFLSLVSFAFQFLTLWWVPALYYSTKNPFLAFGYSVKFLFHKFGASLGIFFFLLLFNFAVSVVNSALASNVWLSLIGFILFFYYATYFVVLIFLYYGKHTKIREHVYSPADYIDNGTDIDGQKLAGGEDSTEA